MEKINRREMMSLSGKGVLTAAALTALMEEGCTLPNWVQTIINDIPTVLQIVLQVYNVVGLYTAKGVDPTVVANAQKIATEIQTDLKNIQTWAGQYSSTPSVLGDIYNALTVVQNNLTAILSTFHVYSNEYTAALGIAVTSALAVITAIQNITPVPTPAPASASAKVMAARAALKSGNQSLTIKLFYNEAMIAAGGSNFAIG